MIDDCATHHAICNQSGPETRSPTRLLRIVDDNISGRRVFLVMTQPERSYRYTALSHCWGSPDEAKKMPKTTRANLLHQQVEGLPVTDLTRTFQDAIKLTVDLGFEYTWIDSLCIIQGDAADWAIESVTQCIWRSQPRHRGNMRCQRQRRTLLSPRCLPAYRYPGGRGGSDNPGQKFQARRLEPPNMAVWVLKFLFRPRLAPAQACLDVPGEASRQTHCSLHPDGAHLGMLDLERL